MFSSYWASGGQHYGYNPFGIQNYGSRAYPWVITAGRPSGNCANPTLPNMPKYGVLVNQFYPDGTPYKQEVEELRNYILNLEATRKIENLANVNFTRPVEPGDTLYYNQSTGNWELTDYLSSGEF
jgi:hypothetical protein